MIQGSHNIKVNGEFSLCGFAPACRALWKPMRRGGKAWGKPVFVNL